MELAPPPGSSLKVASDGRLQPLGVDGASGTGSGCDPVTTLDCPHDIGDPEAGACTSFRRATQTPFELVFEVEP